MTDPSAQSAPTSGNGHAQGIDFGLVSAYAAILAQGQQRQDGWGNIVTGLGQTNKDARVQTRYCTREPINQVTLESLYEQDDIFHLIVDRVPEHGTRRWIRITGATDKSGRPDKDFSRKALEELEKVDAQAKIYDLWRLWRLYGGAAIIIGADDGSGDRLDRPLNLATMKALRFLNVVNRWEITPGLRDRDPLSPNFRQPETYTLNGTAQTIHHTRVIRLDRHQVASDLSVRGVDGWDLPVVEHVWEPLRQFGSLYGYAEGLFQDLMQGVVTLKGLSMMLAQKDGGGDKAVLTRLQTMALVRSTLNMIVLDDGETYERRSQTPTGLADIIIRFMDRLAAAAEMPLSILFGQAPTGLSTDDQGGRRAFYDSVSNKQRRLLRKPITRLLDILIAAKEGPFKGKAPDQWAIDFVPLEEPSEKEIAEQRNLEAQTEERLINLGVVSPEEVRGRYINDPNCPWPLDATTMPEVDPAGDEALAQGLRLQGEKKPARAPSNDPEEDEPATRGDAFDPNQARDEHGRWGESGSSGGSTKEARKADLKARAERHALDAPRLYPTPESASYAARVDRNTERMLAKKLAADPDGSAMVAADRYIVASHERRSEFSEKSASRTVEERVAAYGANEQAEKHEFEALARDHLDTRIKATKPELFAEGQHRRLDRERDKLAAKLANNYSRFERQVRARVVDKLEAREKERAARRATRGDAFDPDQPRANDGKWAGSDGERKRTNSEQRVEKYRARLIEKGLVGHPDRALIEEVGKLEAQREQLGEPPLFSREPEAAQKYYSDEQRVTSEALDPIVAQTKPHLIEARTALVAQRSAIESLAEEAEAAGDTKKSRELDRRLGRLYAAEQRNETKIENERTRLEYKAVAEREKIEGRARRRAEQAELNRRDIIAEADFQGVNRREYLAQTRSENRAARKRKRATLEE